MNTFLNVVGGLLEVVALLFGAGSSTPKRPDWGPDADEFDHPDWGSMWGKK